ncbi:unnamed protein product [Adineta ricciae]|uniref:Uncharacterized protein n=1 Tax=Adineta ricciae TaxID=249248 RepID=A0A816F2G5_ADIRI|nr:unnamed protein product [Adineta ricciae]
MSTTETVQNESNMTADCKQQQQTAKQTDTLPASDSTKSATRNEQHEVDDNQNVGEIGTNLTLIDFLRCYVRIQPCKIEDYGISYSEAIGATFQTYEPPPEQTTKSTQQLQDDDQSNQCIASTAAESNEEQQYEARLDFDDYNMLENYIHVD